MPDNPVRAPECPVYEIFVLKLYDRRSTASVEGDASYLPPPSPLFSILSTPLSQPPITNEENGCL